MSEITVIALDAMGGDNAPGEMVKGQSMPLDVNRI